jgi:membrane-bound lytic murein transglycosylase MltF
MKELSYSNKIVIVLCLLLLIPCASCNKEDEPIIKVDNNDQWLGFETSDSSRVVEKSTDDYPEMEKRRILRVLVSYNNTNYFIEGGRQRGLEYELMEKFEDYLNEGRVKTDEKIDLVFHSVPFKNLIPLIVEGRGDIAAAGLTITAGRKKQVDFTFPYRIDVSEIVVKSKDAYKIDNKYDLSGKKVYVVKGSSYYNHLKDLNDELKKLGKSKIKIIEADSSLVDEDILQMINAGIYKYTVVDDHIAELWDGVLDKIEIQKNAIINEGGSIGWAVRKDNPVLMQKLNEFVKKSGQGTLLGNLVFNRYYKDRKWIDNPLTVSNIKDLEEYESLFKNYGQEYNFDWLFLIAVAFQESHLDQDKKSKAGAVGIMQIKPSTAADKNVDIKGVEKSAEKNIHAATKYLSFLRNSNIGLDSNKWFDNVEQIAMKEIGRETVEYVANIHKYYLAYKTIYTTLQKKKKLAMPKSE